MPGLYVTLLDEDDEYIFEQAVYCEMVVQGGTYYDRRVTDSGGLVKFGLAGDIGVYIMGTTYENQYYCTTVYKASGQQFYTWKLDVPYNPE